MAELKDLKKLSPEERIRKLKELEEDRKREIKEAEAMIRSSKEEIADKEKRKIDIPIPQVGAISVDELFTEEEKQVYESKRGVKRKGKEEISTEDKEAMKEHAEKTLEEEVWRAAPKHENLVEELANRDSGQLYTAAVNTIQGAQGEGRDLNDQERDYLQGIKYATMEKERGIAEGYQTASKQAMEQLGSTESMIKKYLR
jgi:hypothetical protein